ncbi:hypothetical protein BOX09_gp38 [Flavobacterium phage Fpv1]|uniref:Uncharacterized protein n=4 Tax=Fipvunavirus TaxID=2560132 RepID=A0A1B0WKP2_9CAUD|nr:hypothetical protein BOW80_gp37 [Flavobacterium phage Fpv3]YP_009321907.1 hypothetical protein BOW81_gp38 [Flavobacterium phage Fpv20]YP_009322040.1 hypothetical protein BOX09_gp38 [Flavobacterium phage Fpv1]YP_009323629.1 hypothetical protein BOW82_gp38 [Flavobacterium phage Fpv2]YP_009594092.1 hypothetical protein FDG89_gp36 [Flavobacterium phage FpV4]ALN97283.1 hypothetical protein [Flavobacterium phage FpV21]QCW20305.1 hypothetical protein [Flavobacterium phage FPSV-F12]QCW20696.1 hyp
MLKELKQHAQELLDFGDSREKAKGYGMMKVIELVENDYYPKSRSISWSVEDLKHQAENLKGFSPDLDFDETKFEEVLEMIIHKHDANIGINWDVIQIYLMEHCKK